MKTCPKCAEQVQSAAKICKHCGHEFGFKMPKLGCGTLLIVIFVIAYCSGNTPERQAETKALMDAAEKQVDIEWAVKARLRDPASAIFKHAPNGCGLVNSRNGLGGMTGDQAFIVKDGRVILEEDGKPDFRKLWDSQCN
ncbi:MAG: zinc ribbon domain-containing protein [Sphingobium sp.]|nr:zinc ribbon domain-containing protein [Sphingobium sp.]